MFPLSRLSTSFNVEDSKEETLKELAESLINNLLGDRAISLKLEAV